MWLWCGAGACHHDHSGWLVPQRIVELTNNASLTANIALVKNNAHVGSQIACSLASKLRASSAPASTSATATPGFQRTLFSTFAPSRRQLSMSAVAQGGRGGASPVVVGGAVIDIVGRPDSASASLRTSNPGVVRKSFGGERWCCWLPWQSCVLVGVCVCVCVCFLHLLFRSSI